MADEGYATEIEDLDLDAINLTVVDPPDLQISAVPEPTTWAMMLIGFNIVVRRL